MRWFDVGQEAEGVIAIGQQATGVIAIGQLALGVVAIGQLARGVIVIGQLGIGVVTVGQLPLGVVWSAGMVGVGGTSPGWLVLSLLPRRKAVADSPYAILAGGRARASTGRLLLGVAGVMVLALLWWISAGQDVLDALFGPGGVLNSERQLR